LQVRLALLRIALFSSGCRRNLRNFLFFLMRLVILESPYAGDVEANVEYARRAVRDSLSRGEAPIASHLLYTQPGILDDNKSDERQWGIDAGLAWRKVAEGSVVYVDRGISGGMIYGMKAAWATNRTINFRSIEGNQHLVDKAVKDFWDKIGNA
jgi:hypothetical protein